MAVSRHTTVGRLSRYPGPPDRKAAQALTKYIIIDMYPKAIQGMPAEAAVKWAHDEVVKPCARLSLQMS